MLAFSANRPQQPSPSANQLLTVYTRTDDDGITDGREDDCQGLTWTHHHLLWITVDLQRPSAEVTHKPVHTSTPYPPRPAVSVSLLGEQR